jgi:hypothetical protein
VKFYAERPVRRYRQIAADLLAVAWVYAWVRFAIWFHDLVTKLAAPGQQLEESGRRLSDNLTGAGNRIADLPAVGKSVATPLRQAASAANGISGAGRQEQAVVHDLAITLTVLLVIIPLALVVFGWLPHRVRWIRRAGAAAALRGAQAGKELLAVRALATQPLRRLVALDPDIATAWRRGDAEAVENLAALELRRWGLR